jgi:hypothetical protein
MFAGGGAAAGVGAAGLSAASLAPAAAGMFSGITAAGVSQAFAGVTGALSLASTASKMMGSKKGMNSIQVPNAQNLPDINPSMDSERVLEARAKKLRANKGGREGTMLTKFDDDKDDTTKKKATKLGGEK